MRSICLVASGMYGRNRRLQPWRYLTEVANQLSRLSHPVTVISDQSKADQAAILNDQVKLLQLPSISSPHWRKNQQLMVAIKQCKPEIVLWHLGLTSFLHQSIPQFESFRSIGLFTSPIYSLKELSRLGWAKLIKNRPLSAIHILGSLAPRRLLGHLAGNSHIDRLVVQTETTREQLIENGLWSKPIDVIPPGVDGHWTRSEAATSDRIKASWGFSQNEIVLLYFGSPAPLRGLHTLVKAFWQALPENPDLRLVILSRRRAGELLREDAELRRLLAGQKTAPFVKVISGFLDPEILVESVAAANIVALPFELVLSDAPLSPLETQALGKPLITTRTACLPELAAYGAYYLAEPGDTRTLVTAIEMAVKNISNDGNKISKDQSQLVKSWQVMGAEWSNLIQHN